ncbi:trans-aconitate 2-methyltransferase [Streptomyces sp. AC536]|uniref:trans-aconitate 2-methyltransferase n=1 Tax=Streptomyces buecherae TaxID=2763006 RepID=UPI00164E7CBF|nr:trans-aconitate 2-methyltransferase [Streptomyces buecherae]MBC3985469.1 trans-aconitate 2-methyltransferase [Streptomyces buecherae]QNJ40495.1 trans-aconitate 2-methyltransferase [Streptomyces buecherae]
MPELPLWDPKQYLRHSVHRTRPFLDLLARIPDLPAPPADRAPDGPTPRPTTPAPRIADLGCGPGNVTALLATRWPTAHITGYDNSTDMLREAQAHAGPTEGGGRLDFRPADAATWVPDEPYDLIVSNAALQWVPNHPESFESWVGALTPGGTFAFQVPGNFVSPSHALLGELCDTPRWRDRLDGQGRRFVHILSPAAYLERLIGLGCTVDAWETTYVQVLAGADPVLDWVKGTALRPILTALADDPETTAEFLAEYRDLLRKAYPQGPYGTVFPFRRIFVVARRADG